MSKVTTIHDARWIFEMSGAYLIVLKDLSGVSKSVISVPEKTCEWLIPNLATIIFIMKYHRKQKKTLILVKESIGVRFIIY